MSTLVNRRTGAVLLLGFASGLPLALSGGTLQAWLTVAGVDIRAIGLFALVTVPYTFKFLWAPLLDRIVPPWLGRRRGWMLLTQVALVVAIAVMAGVSPRSAPWSLAAIALGVAVLSATQDIAIDAYRTEILAPRERGFGAAMFVAGYRVAMLVSGAGALVLADRAGFPQAYAAMAALMLIGIVATAVAPAPPPSATPATVRGAYWAPLAQFLGRPGAVAMLALIVLYKLGDAVAGTLTTAFLIRAGGFTPAEVGYVYKGFGLAVTLFGLLAGGTLMARLGLYRSLLAFGVLQAVTNLGFMALAGRVGDFTLMAVVVGLENFAGGMGTAAFVALLMSLCDSRYTAAQYALLSALSAVGRVFVGPPAGYVVDAVGWSAFFLASFVVALPGLYLLRRLRAVIMVSGNDG
ncbi:MAG: MFS transporter [Gammaproteobacteria bacterium]|nr:MFS transporter [Gammaproteobacteria bacterium]